jgi:hypothetical protein
VNRIFLTLAVTALLMLTATMVVGLSLGDVRNPADATTQRWATLHRLSGVATGVTVLLVHSVAITYFIGTARWCREVCETYRLDLGPARRSNSLKRRTFAVACLSMLAAVGMVALGGAADPGAALQIQPPGMPWATVHLLGSLIGTAWLAAAAFVEWSLIAANQAILAEVVEQVRDIRRQKGLEV